MINEIEDLKNVDPQTLSGLDLAIAIALICGLRHIARTSNGQGAVGTLPPTRALYPVARPDENPDDLKQVTNQFAGQGWDWAAGSNVLRSYLDNGVVDNAPFCACIWYDRESDVRVIACGNSVEESVCRATVMAWLRTLPEDREAVAP